MSDPMDHMPERDGLAAEYVLGTLALPERLVAEQLMADDPKFARLVTDWQARLAPLNDGYDPLTPPASLLPRIEARLFPQPERSRWRLPAFGALGAALAALALVVYWPASAPHDLRSLTLTGESQPLVVAAIYDATAQEITFTRSAGPQAEPGKDYELWVIPAGQKPVSLGVLRDQPAHVAMASLPAGTTLAVTLETAGGSPTGQAQGPLLVATVIEG